MQDWLVLSDWAGVAWEGQADSLGDSGERCAGSGRVEGWTWHHLCFCNKSSHS